MREQLNQHEGTAHDLVSKAFDAPQQELAKGWDTVLAHDGDEAGSGRRRKAYNAIDDAEKARAAQEDHQRRVLAHVQGSSTQELPPRKQGRHARPEKEGKYSLAAQFIPDSDPGQPRRAEDREREDATNPHELVIDRPATRPEHRPRSIGEGTHAIHISGVYRVPRDTQESTDQVAAPEAAPPAPVRPSRVPFAPGLADPANTSVFVPVASSVEPAFPLVPRTPVVPQPEEPRLPDVTAETHASADAARRAAGVPVPWEAVDPDFDPANSPSTDPEEFDDAQDTPRTAEPQRTFYPPFPPAADPAALPGIAGRVRPVSNNSRRGVVSFPAPPVAAEAAPMPDGPEAVREAVARYGFFIQDGIVYREATKNGNPVKRRIGDATQPGILEIIDFEGDVESSGDRRAAIENLSRAEIQSVLAAQAANAGATLDVKNGKVRLGDDEEDINLWISSNIDKLEEMREALKALSAGSGVPAPTSAIVGGTASAVPALPIETVPADGSDTGAASEARSDTDDSSEGDITDPNDPNDKWWRRVRPQGSDEGDNTPSAPTPSRRHRGPGRVRRQFTRERVRRGVAAVAGVAALAGMAWLGASSGSDESTPNERRLPATASEKPGTSAPPSSAATQEQSPSAAPTTAAPTKGPAASPTNIPTAAPTTATPVETAPPVAPPPASPATPGIPGGQQPSADETRKPVNNPLDTITFANENGQDTAEVTVKAGGTTSNAIYDTLEAHDSSKAGNLAATYKLVDDLERQGFNVHDIEVDQKFEITFDKDGIPQAIIAAR